MDAVRYKDYLLVLLFVKYVSDKYAGDPDALISAKQANCWTSTRRTTSCVRRPTTNRLAVAQVNTHSHKGRPCSFQPVSSAYTISA
jgi:hypothetical protein